MVFDELGYAFKTMVFIDIVQVGHVLYTIVPYPFSMAEREQTLQNRKISVCAYGTENGMSAKDRDRFGYGTEICEHLVEKNDD